jgi:hypothetical protein
MLALKDSIIRYSKQLYQTLGNRRRDERHPISGTVNVTVKNQYGQLSTRTCKCLNLSATGLALESEEAIPISSAAYLYSSQHGMKGFAAVRHCLRHGSGYHVGMQFRAAPKVWDGY